MKHPKGPKEQHHAHGMEDVLSAAQKDERSRRNLLICGVANGALVASSVYVAARTGAHPTFAESIHDLNDVSYYATPWFATLRSRLDSVHALKWMRRSMQAAAAVALGGIAFEATELATHHYEKPSWSSIPLQAGFAIANGAIAFYLGHRHKHDHGGDSSHHHHAIDKTSLRHARVDAGTSLLATAFNAASQALPILSPAGAIVVNSLSLQCERRNLEELSELNTQADAHNELH